ncbi:hypothetical protein PST407_02634 [Pseudomonas syringae pv. tomato]|nr:hypothetical protein PST407_02634 [Pseudomonas syringae pv. tomato]
MPSVAVLVAGQKAQRAATSSRWLERSKRTGKQLAAQPVRMLSKACWSFTALKTPVSAIHWLLLSAGTAGKKTSSHSVAKITAATLAV